jgi:SpoIID/LytB domain protein
LALVMPAGADRTYRTALRSVQPSSGSSSRDTVNVLSVENYTRGVVAREMPASWHAEALKAQSVAARTYGVRAISSTRHYDICDTTSCQVYGGVSAETSATDSAVAGTAGKIVTSGGKPALTQFSSSSGGHTSAGSTAYLKAINDPWDSWSGNANHSWTKAVKASTIQAKYPKIGTLKSLQVTKRNGYGDFGGRVTSLKIVGSKGTTTISGDTARFAFGLRSNWFAF